MSESRIILVEHISSSKPTIQQVDSFIRDLNLMGKHIEVKTNRPEVAALITSLIGNMNKVVIVNGIVVKSFDNNYTVGEVIGWFGDYETINF